MGGSATSSTHVRHALRALLSATGALSLALVLALIIIFIVFQGIGRPVLWEIPDGYVGWVEVQFGEPTCPPLRDAGIYLVVPVSSSGRGCTSANSLGSVWRYHRFESVRADGTREETPHTSWGGGGRIWALSFGGQGKVASFFVGSEAELNESWASRPRS